MDSKISQTEKSIIKYTDRDMEQAIKNGNLKKMKQLFSKVNYRHLELTFNRHIYIAISNGRLEAMKLYDQWLKEHGLLYVYDLEWLYQEAVKVGRIDIFQLLITWDKNDDLCPYLLLDAAVEYGYIDIMKYLANLMQNNNKKIYYDDLMRKATANNQVEVIKLIKEWQRSNKVEV